MLLDVSRAFAANSVLCSSFEECCQCLRAVERAGRSVLVSPSATQKEFRICANGYPAEMYLPHRNFFSVFFQSVYRLLDVSVRRRILYGRINYLFRIWVTSADNLLDTEDKISFPVKMPVDSRTMRQVVAIMTADRILARFLDEAVAGGVITREDSLRLSDATLQVLLPSAAEEASEEGGIKNRPVPEYVLDTIHVLKTGLLFRLPLLGPEQIETNINRKRIDACRDGLGKFGIGCQLLDDMRDLSRDHLEKRQNYALSLFTHKYPQAQKRLRGMDSSLKVEDAIFPMFADELKEVARMGYDHMMEGLSDLNRSGLGLGKEHMRAIVQWVFYSLGVKKAVRWLA
jgi:hypothetical protein